MKIIFINITRNLIIFEPRQYHPRHILPPIADLGYCIAILEQYGHDVSIIDTSVENYNFTSICQKIKDGNFDLAVLRPNISASKLTLQLAKTIREYCKYIIAVGPIVSTSLDFFIFKDSPIDFCVFGEPEYTIAEAVEKLKNGYDLIDVAGMAYYKEKLVIGNPRNLCENIDSLPFPKHEYFLDKPYTFQYPFNINNKIRFAAMLTSRGCPHQCLFCSPIKRVSYGTKYRMRSIENIICEIEFLKSKGVNIIYFIDDLFTFDNRAYPLCEELVRRNVGIKWAAQIRADLDNYSMLVKMKQAGCVCVNIGIETANQESLGMLKKGTTLGSIERVVGWCKKVGINVVGDFIIGIPGQNFKDIKESLIFAKKLKFDMVEALLFTPYPGSDFCGRYSKLEDIDDYSDYDNVKMSYCCLTPEELKKSQIEFYRSYYLNIRFIFNFLWRYKNRIMNNLFSEGDFLKKAFRFICNQSRIGTCEDYNKRV